MAKIAQKRSVAVKVNLTPEVYGKLKAVSEDLGQAPALLASLAIGEYVSNNQPKQIEVRQNFDAKGVFWGDKVIPWRA